MSGTDKKRTIAVTGATGLLGRHLCDYFSKKGWQVNALVRDVDKYPFSEKGINMFKCILPDIIEPESIASADVLIHCAYMTRFTNLDDAKRVNEEGTVKLLEAVRNVGVKKFVFISSRAARQDAQSYYGQSKYKLESMMDMSHDLIIRPGLVLANDGGLFYRIFNQVQRLPVIPVFGGGNQKLNTVHIDDLCYAFESAIEQNMCGIMTIAERDGITMKEIIRAILSQLGQNKLIVSIPGKPAVLLLQLLESLKFKLPVSSENLRGLLSIDDSESPIPESMSQTDIKIRSFYESVKSLIPES